MAILSVLPPTNQTRLPRLLQVAWILTFNCIKLRGSHACHTRVIYVLDTKQVCLGPVKRATCTDVVAKSRTPPPRGRTTVYLLSQPTATWFVAETGLNVASKTPPATSRFNSCCKTSCTGFFCPFCRTSSLACEQALRCERVKGAGRERASQPLARLLLTISPNGELACRLL